MINAIFATDEEGGMGLNGSMPWPRNDKDLDWFKINTSGHIVVMGRGTWDASDMPKPLPKRENWVVTSGTIEPDLNGAHVWRNEPFKLLYKLERDNPNKIVWVIGGAKLLTSLTGLFDRMYVTRFEGAYGCDAKVDFEKLISNYKEIYRTEYLDLEHLIYAKLPTTAV
jgi:dihydrofolate reductase